MDRNPFLSDGEAPLGLCVGRGGGQCVMLRTPLFGGRGGGGGGDLWEPKLGDIEDDGRSSLSRGSNNSSSSRIMDESYAQPQHPVIDELPVASVAPALRTAAIPRNTLLTEADGMDILLPERVQCR